MKCGLINRLRTICGVSNSPASSGHPMRGRDALSASLEQALATAGGTPALLFPGRYFARANAPMKSTQNATA